jgi:hypothetical protein
MGYVLVPVPKILANVQLNGGALLYGEPVLANGNVYVSTASGYVFMLQP